MVWTEFLSLFFIKFAALFGSRGTFRILRRFGDHISQSLALTDLAASMQQSFYHGSVLSPPLLELV